MSTGRNIALTFNPHDVSSFKNLGPGPNFIALLNGKQICVLTVAENWAAILRVYRGFAL